MTAYTSRCGGLEAFALHVVYVLAGIAPRPMIHRPEKEPGLCADSDEVAPAYRDDLAPCSDMMSPPGPVPLAMGLLALSRLSSIVLLI